MKTKLHYRILVFILLLFLPKISYSQCAPTEVNLGHDTTLCQGETLSFDLSNLPNNPTVTWEDGSTSLTRTISTAGVYVVETKYLGGELVINGDFSQGDVGFNTDYVLGTSGPWGPLSNPGTYAITTSPHLVHNNFGVCSDLSGGGNMLVVNGASTPGTNVWCQTINVTPNTDYEFSTWVTNALFDYNVAQLQFSINGVTLGNVFSTSVQSCNWSQFFEIWNSGTSTTAQICILNLNTFGGGNDFAIDNISFSPVCISTDTIVVSYATSPVFNLPVDYQSCQGSSVTLNAENPWADFLWSTGETTQTIEVINSGTYVVNVSDDGYCEEERAYQVVFHEPSSAGNDANFTFCNTEQSVDLYTLIADPSVETTGTWYDQQFNQILGGVFNFGQLEGLHQLYYVVSSDYCPDDTASYFIDIKTFISAGEDLDLFLCNEGEYDLNQWETSPDHGHWESLNGLPLNGGKVSLQSLPKDAYEFIYVVNNEPFCPNDTAHAIINLSEVPNVIFEADTYEGCSPLAVTFNDLTVAHGEKSYKWFINDVLVSQNESFSNVFEHTQCYDIGLEITMDNLCVSEFLHSNMVCVNPDPVAGFSFNPALVFSDNPAVDFENVSVSNVYNQWYFDDLGQSNEEHPHFVFPEGKAGNYEVKLIVTSEKGCMDSITKVVTVQDQTIFYVPNAFSPNGDEFNNVFLPMMTVGVDIENYNLKIFNRWGECVYETNDYHAGWDGTYMNKLVEEGTYVWIIRFEELYTTDVVQLTGVVSVLQ